MTDYVHCPTGGVDHRDDVVDEFGKSIRPSAA
jgi:hypothetical protein